MFGSRSTAWKQGKRLEELNDRVPDRVCPACNHVFLKSRSWVMLRKEHDLQLPDGCRAQGAMCKSCYMKMVHGHVTTA